MVPRCSSRRRIPALLRGFRGRERRVSTAAVDRREGKPPTPPPPLSAIEAIPMTTTRRRTTTTIPRFGIGKRQLVTLAAACAALPRSGRFAVGEAPSGNAWRKPYHSGPPPPPPSRTDAAEAQSLSEVLRTLVRRRGEPVPLRAAATTTTTTAEAAAVPPTDGEGESPQGGSAAEERRRMSELAEELVEGYDDLPPLRGFGTPRLETGDDGGGGDDDDDIRCERSSILEFLAMECRPDEAGVETAAKEYLKHATAAATTTTSSPNRQASNHLEKLKEAATPAYEGLLDFVLRQHAVTGMGFLVALREDLLSSLRYQRRDLADGAESTTTRASPDRDDARARHRRFRDLDGHLRSVLSRWFAPGLLVHERLTYEKTPAEIIEAIATKEAVHPMKSLDDLKDRLGASKRVYALFHPCLPHRPLAVVHAALLPPGKVPASMDDIMASSGETAGGGPPHDDPPPGVAAFYSISNGVRGLAGVGLGEHLLKESIRALTEEIPSLETFVTLSPVPGFREWITVSCLREAERHRQQRTRTAGDRDDVDDDDEEESTLLSREDRAALLGCGLVSSAAPFPWREFLDSLEGIDFAELVRAAGSTTDREVYDFLLRGSGGGGDPSEVEDVDDDDVDEPLGSRRRFFVLRSVLLRLAARYLALEKHRGRPLNKVCGFHAGNGAELHAVLFGADLSRGGLTKSYGLMANYRYETGEAGARNQARFESSGFAVPVGPAVREWLAAAGGEDDEYDDDGTGSPATTTPRGGAPRGVWERIEAHRESMEARGKLDDR